LVAYPEEPRPAVGGEVVVEPFEVEGELLDRPWRQRLPFGWPLDMHPALDVVLLVLEGVGDSVGDPEVIHEPAGDGLAALLFVAVEKRKPGRAVIRCEREDRLAERLGLGRDDVA